MDADVDLNEWYFGLDYDEDKISVVWEDEEDEDNLTITISRVANGVTDGLRIYAVDAEGKEIHFIKPAFVEIE